jgi:tetratricopeptide (TPR) repeat protein
MFRAYYYRYTGGTLLMPDTTLPDFDSLWDYDNPAETEQKFRSLLPAAETSGDRSYHLELLTQIARTHSLRSEFDKSHAILDQVEPQLTTDLARARVRYQLERGRAFNSAGKKEQAQPLFLKAFEEAVAAGEEFHAIDAAHMMAIVEPPEEQINWSLKALELTEKTTDPRAAKWKGPLYNNLGWTYHDMGDYHKAMELFRKGVEFRATQGKPVPYRIAKWTVARCQRSLGQVEEALAAQRELLIEWEAAGQTGPYVLEELGECLFTLDRQEEARPYFARAYEELSKDTWLVNNEPERLARLKQLGEGG